MVDVQLNGKTADFILSNDNKDCCGVWGDWFNDRLVLKAEDFSPMQKFMDQYSTKMENDKAHRDMQEWEEHLEEQENLPPPQTPEQIKSRFR